MRNAKKLLLLLLSIALLCGIFIVTALAEDGDASAEPAKDYVTVVYPGDIGAKTFNLGDTLSLETLELGAFETKTKSDGTGSISLCTGPYNTLFKDDSTPGFVFALQDLNDPAVIEKRLDIGQEGIVVDENLLGRKIYVIGVASRVFAVLWNDVAESSYFAAWATDLTSTQTQIQTLVMENRNSQAKGLLINRKVTLYSDISFDGKKTTYRGDTGYFDLNGHTLTFASAENEPALDVNAGTLYVYSSKAGGKVVYGVDGKALVKASGNGTVCFGEKESPSTEYGKNLTVEVSRFNNGCDGGGIKILGGTYIQPAGTSATTFLVQGGAKFDITNATFILKGELSALWQPGLTGNVLKNSGGKGDAGHVTVISEKEIKLFNDAFPDSVIASIQGVNFNYWYFYNVKPSLPSVQYYYPESFFDKSYTDVFGNTNPLRIAYAADKKTKTVDGEEYTFRAKQELEGNTALVHWGFDIPAEYWVVKAQASNDAVVVIDELFAYGFAPFEVQEGDNYPTPTILKAVKPGTISMSLTLQSQISMNLFFSDALNGATIKVDGTPLEEGKRTCTYAVAPDVANIGVTVTIGIGENTHTVQVNVGSYASAVLASTEEEYASARNLTYAMVEYVRVMANDPDFLKDVSVPTGYETYTPGKNEAANEGTLLESIAFKLDSTIALAILGKDDAAKGKVVTLELADRTLTATIGENKQAIFEGLYVNEFYGDLTLTVEGETYTYSIENYYNAIANKDAVAALYNYVEYANAYVNYLKENS